jgi:ParB-like chromosome segregation protein Spo0J
MLKIISVKIAEVKPNPNNPRLIKDDKFVKLVNSIKEFPKMLEIRPIVVNDDMVVLGGNMRLKACKEAGLKEVPIIKATDLTEEQQKEFIIKDNIGFGEWDWGIISSEWDVQKIEEWGLDLTGFNLDSDDLGTDFSLPDGDKSPFQQMTFTLADEQAEQIKNAISDIKETEEYKYAETMGNENSNGNALYLIIMQWAGQKK